MVQGTLGTDSKVVNRTVAVSELGGLVGSAFAPEVEVMAVPELGGVADWDSAR